MERSMARDITLHNTRFARIFRDRRKEELFFRIVVMRQHLEPGLAVD
jgi:hypothetical protein